MCVYMKQERAPNTAVMKTLLRPMWDAERWVNCVTLQGDHWPWCVDREVSARAPIICSFMCGGWSRSRFLCEAARSYVEPFGSCVEPFGSHVWNCLCLCGVVRFRVKLLVPLRFSSVSVVFEITNKDAVLWLVFLLIREILGGELLKSEIEWSAYLWKFQAKS